MGKKRKGSSGASGVKPAESRKIGHVKSYEDVADSEDEFHMNRDMILLDEGPDAKRVRRWEEEDALLEPSDEEILAYESNDEEEHDVEDEDDEGWGTSRKEYYGGDEVATEADAEALEKEALRIQQKRLKGMTEADFGLDDEWLEGVDEGKGTVTEVLTDFEITAETSPQERAQILQTHYPEFDLIADEFLKLQPLLEDLRARRLNFRALTVYVATLAMYFALISSGLNPTDLHDHPVMETIVKAREVWEEVRAKSLQEPSPDSSRGHAMEGAETEEDELATSLYSSHDNSDLDEDTHTHTSSDETAKKSISRKSYKSQDGSASGDDTYISSRVALDKLDKKFHESRNKGSIPVSQSGKASEDDSDFGEETHLSSRAAAEKAQKKKSLRFYTSQIVQKSNKRAGAGRDAGGDIDVPYKERIRDRQARLNVEAEKRGRKLDEYGRGAELSDGDEDEEVGKGAEVEEDDYYDMVTQTNKKRKLDKSEKYDAIKKAKAENAIVRVVEKEEDGKRAIGYVIEKNKGLAPKRKKDVRNPRVKKRKKYEEKKKKLSSMKAVYQGEKIYGGEKTGIKTGLVKSVKLS